MNRFKRIFYLICLIFFLVGFFIFLFQDDILKNTDSFLYVGFFGLIKFFIKFGGFGVFLFIVELISGYFQIKSLKSKIETLEGEKQELKAKLYDKEGSNTVTLSAKEGESNQAANEKTEPENEI